MKKGILTALLVLITSMGYADPAKVACPSPQPPHTNANIESFAETAAIQSFTYDFQSMSKQLSALETCYTKTGWNSFTSALTRSGNVDTAKKLKIHAKAERTGAIKILDKNTETNTYRVLVPIKVTYNNATEEMTQILDVKLLVNINNKKMGVEQITASPSLMPKKPEPKKETPVVKQQDNNPPAVENTPSHRDTAQNNPLPLGQAEATLNEGENNDKTDNNVQKAEKKALQVEAMTPATQVNVGNIKINTNKPTTITVP